MPSGILGRNTLTAVTNTTVYTVPASTRAVLTLNLVNCSNVGANVRVALSNSGTPAVQDFIEFDADLPPTQVLERTGIVMEATRVLVVHSSIANVVAVAYGYEETA